MEVWSFISSFSSSLQKLLKLLVKQASVKQTHEEMQSLLTSQRSPGFSSSPHRVKYQRYQTNPDLNPWGRKDLPQMTREWSPGTFFAWFPARLSNETDRQPVLRSMIEKFPLNYHASLGIMTISWYSSLQFLLLMTVMMILNCILRYFSHSVSPSDFFAFETPLTVFVSVIHPLLLLLILFRILLLFLLRKRFSHQMISQSLSSHHHQDYDAHSVSRSSIDYSSYLLSQNFPWPVSSLFFLLSLTTSFQE